MNSKKDVAQGKSSNTKRVLRCIQVHSPISRAEIAAKMQLSKPTVSLIVDELIRENWVYEKRVSASSTSQKGRKPIQLFFKEKAAFVIGTHIGGTSVKMIVSDLNGNIIYSSRFFTSHYVQAGLLEEMSKAVTHMLDHLEIQPFNILGMGIAISGITQDGIVLEAPCLNWTNYPLIEEANKHFSFPVYIDNDVNVAVLGEQWIGCAKGYRDVLFMAVGNEIGSGMIINDQLYRGHSHIAGKIGHIDRNHANNEFNPFIHRYNYFEGVVSHDSIGHKLTALGLENHNPPAPEEAHSNELSGVATIYLENTRDQIAPSDAVNYLGFRIISAACLLNPEVIILGGGAFHSSNNPLPKLKKMIEKHLPTPLNIRISQLGENAGVLGAVSLFLREHEGMIHSS
jgi:glucokinase